MSIGTGHSIWIVPPRASKAFGRLKRLINELSSTYGTAEFDPHVTLIGGVEADELHEKAQQLASRLSEFALTLGTLGTHGVFFRQLFAEVIPTRHVSGAHAAACEVLALEQQPYSPHLSLLYGDVPGNHVAEEAAPLIRAAGVIETTFLASNLELWRTQGPVDAWRLLATYPLHRQERQ